MLNRRHTFSSASELPWLRTRYDASLRTMYQLRMMLQSTYLISSSSSSDTSGDLHNGTSEVDDRRQRKKTYEVLTAVRSSNVSHSVASGGSDSSPSSALSSTTEGLRNSTYQFHTTSHNSKHTHVLGGCLPRRPRLGAALAVDALYAMGQ